jgi:hypothetical protein
MNNYIDNFIRFLIIGILSAYLLIYGLRPSVPYPEQLLELCEHYWVLLIIIIINYYLLLWDLRIAALTSLSVIALIFDLILFTK